MVDVSKLSPQTQELIKLAGAGDRSGPADIQAVLASRPDLIAGINEYLAWHREHWMSVSQDQTTSPIAHPLSGISQSLDQR